LAVCFIVDLVFRKPIDSILRRIINDKISEAWTRYIRFALYVVGISGGVRIYALEQYINPRGKDNPAIELNMDRWVLELYRTIIEAMQSIATMLLVFFACALIAYLIVRLVELRRPPKDKQAAVAT
jgi:hypothetical protein